ncbi:GlxA family transcriptional regulator [Neisseria sp.]|uniref:GlxA family transcriptional regulator n=1 Tax=Neisseria sp. TaxID=192066 RepID=UPI002899DDBA|nr:GlxA family transcriptional regulator [Neisseria sp.]
MTMPATKHQIGFVLLEGFSMIAFSNAIEAFRMANYVSNQDLYHFPVTGLTGAHTSASNHISVNHTAQMSDLLRCDLIFVCGGFDLNKLKNSGLRTWLQRYAQKGAALGGVCTGAFALADAGLLNDYRASIHWENMLAAKETFPQTQFNTSIYTIDRNRYTCSGGTAALDLCINIIRLNYERKLSESVAEQFTLSTLRGEDEPQHIPLSAQLNSGYNYVVEALVLMDKNLEEPLPIHEIAQLLGISVRQLERWFNSYFNKPPQLYYIEVRLLHAKRLLKQTNKSIMDVALACGFSNPSSFSKAYRSQFSLTPSQTRKQTMASAG